MAASPMAILHVILCISCVVTVVATERKNRTNTSPRGASRKAIDIPGLVLNLRTQLKQSKTSQARTRSSLNVLSEKQESQESDLAALKNELRALREQQNRDKDLILQLQTMASDNGWGIANLKAAQDQVNKDFVTFKKLQERYNKTMVHMEEFLLTNEQAHKGYQMAIRNLRKEMIHVRKLINEDRGNFVEFKRIVESEMTRAVEQDTLPLNGPEERTNRIPTLRSEGEKEEGEEKEEREERYNSVQLTLEQLAVREEELSEDLDGFKGKFVQYDGELARIYSMYFNLSLQLSQLENKLLMRQQAVFQTDLHDMQRMFVNFTQQIINMEQQTAAFKKADVGGVLRATRERHQDITAMASTIARQTVELRTIEDELGTFKRANRADSTNINATIAELNATIGGFARSLAAHNTKATNVFTDVDDKLMEYHVRIKSNLARLTSIEVRVLNASLEQCRKTNADLVQDIKLADIGRGVNKVDRIVSDQNTKIAKMDSSVSQLFEENKDNMRIIEGIEVRMNDMMDIEPKVTSIQQEMNNLIFNLPRDCTEVGETMTHHGSGQYLVKADRSERSERVRCEFDEAGSWTVIQHRVDGAESFDRTWREYSDGFGDLDANFWIGLEYLHSVTTQHAYKLRIQMTSLTNEFWEAEYNSVVIGDEASNYKLRVGGYRGNATDALKYSDEMPFSTVDRDNDVSSTHCAKFYTAGWWYKHCHYCNLNGRYTVGVVWFNQDFDEWVQMGATKMMIQRVNATMTGNNGTETMTPTGDGHV